MPLKSLRLLSYKKLHCWIIYKNNATSTIFHKDCSQGIIKGCGCDPNLKKNMYRDYKSIKLFLRQGSQNSAVEKDWAWGGCSDDASFGENLVLKLLEDGEKYSDLQSFVSRHNNRIGSEIIREKMLKTCKCH